MNGLDNISVTRVLVILKKWNRDADFADEYSAMQITKYINTYYREHNCKMEIKLCSKKSYHRFLGWNPTCLIFVGLDEIYLEVLKRFPHSRVLLWAKCHDLFKDNKYSLFRERANWIFDSCFYSFHKWGSSLPNYRYLPTGFHKPCLGSGRQIRRFTPKEIYTTQVETFLARNDLIFSGSPRFNRPDRYRQRLLAQIAELGVRVGISAPRKIWNRVDDDNFDKYTRLGRITFSPTKTWADQYIYNFANKILDLPWLDSIVEDLEQTKDPQFALGWNVFRAGSSGANLLTYDCEMNRGIGLTLENADFYMNGIDALDKLAIEIAEKVYTPESAINVLRKNNIKKLFYSRHSYETRWETIFDNVDQ